MPTISKQVWGHPVKSSQFENYLLSLYQEIKINGENICKKHFENVLGESFRHRTAFKNMV
jgi:hypothetical protein